MSSPPVKTKESSPTAIKNSLGDQVIYWDSLIAVAEALHKGLPHKRCLFNTKSLIIRRAKERFLAKCLIIKLITKFKKDHHHQKDIHEHPLTAVLFLVFSFISSSVYLCEVSPCFPWVPCFFDSVLQIDPVINSPYSSFWPQTQRKRALDSKFLIGNSGRSSQRLRLWRKFKSDCWSRKKPEMEFKMFIELRMRMLWRSAGVGFPNLLGICHL